MCIAAQLQPLATTLELRIPGLIPMINMATKGRIMLAKKVNNRTIVIISRSHPIKDLEVKIKVKALARPLLESTNTILIAMLSGNLDSELLPLSPR